MSLRVKVLLWIITVNIGIAAFLTVVIHGSVEAQRRVHSRTLDEIRANSEEILLRFSNILLFEESLSRLAENDITTSAIINWPQWDYFADAIVLKNYVAFEDEIIYTDIELNPLGTLHRSPAFDGGAAMDMLKAAIAGDRRVVRGGSMAIPIHVSDFGGRGSTAGGASARGTRVWGAAFVLPRFPAIEEPGGTVDLTVFWVAMAGGTLILIAASFTILSRLVIRPVEDMARVADQVASGDYAPRCRGSGSRDEVGRLTESFNYMIGEVADYHGHLEKKVAEAQEKVKLAEKHLTVAQRLASTGKLAAGIAHEINNPIGGMINAALRLKEDAEPGSRDEIYLNLIIEGLERIMKTVRKILAFSPRSAEPRPAALSAILHDVEALVEHRLKAKNIRFEMTLKPKDLSIVCEAGEIRQVFLNILLNAVDAVAGAGGRIAVIARRDDKEKTAVVETADDGCGMSEELLAHAFDPFYSTKGAGEGTGLGLSIAHNIVTNHGGRIEVDTAPGQGTTIRVILPLSRSPPPDH